MRSRIAASAPQDFDIELLEEYALDDALGDELDMFEEGQAGEAQGKAGGMLQCPSSGASSSSEVRPRARPCVCVAGPAQADADTCAFGIVPFLGPGDLVRGRQPLRAAHKHVDAQQQEAQGGAAQEERAADGEAEVGGGSRRGVDGGEGWGGLWVDAPDRFGMSLILCCRERNRILARKTRLRKKFFFEVRGACLPAGLHAGTERSS
jgi:hypothetical protein